MDKPPRRYDLKKSLRNQISPGRYHRFLRYFVSLSLIMSKVIPSAKIGSHVVCKFTSASGCENIVNSFSGGQLSGGEGMTFRFNMRALAAYLKKQSEQGANASYYNIDILKYQVRLLYDFLEFQCLRFILI